MGALCGAFSSCFWSCFLMLFSMFLAARERRRRAKIDTPSERKPVFSRCAPAPAQAQGRQQKAKKTTQNKHKKEQKINKKVNFQAPGADFQKYLPKSRAGTSSGASGERPGRPKKAPGGAKSAPRRPQDDPKSRQERPKSRPEAVSERPWWPPGAHLAPKRPPEASGRHFDRLGGGFLALRGSIFEAFSACCEAFRGASASAGWVGGTREALTI